MVMTNGQRALCVEEQSPIVDYFSTKYLYVPNTNFLLLARFEEGNTIRTTNKKEQDEKNRYSPNPPCRSCPYRHRRYLQLRL